MRARVAVWQMHLAGRVHDTLHAHTHPKHTHTYTHTQNPTHTHTHTILHICISLHLLSLPPSVHALGVSCGCSGCACVRCVDNLRMVCVHANCIWPIFPSVFSACGCCFLFKPKAYVCLLPPPHYCVAAACFWLGEMAQPIAACCGERNRSIRLERLFK